MLRPAALLALIALLLVAAPAAAQRCDINGGNVIGQNTERSDPGDEVQVAYVFGIGVGCPAFAVRVLLSEDRYPSTDDVAVGTDALPASGPQTNVSGSLTFAVPDVPRGGFRVLVVADPDDEIDEGFEENNVNFGRLTVGGFSGGPDLVIVQAELEDEMAAPGDRIEFEYGEQNQGGTDVGDVEVGFYLGLRNSGEVPPPLYLMGRETVGNVEAGETEEESEEVEVPSTVAPGVYGIEVWADDENAVAEFDETNNMFGLGPLTVTGPVSSEPGTEASGASLGVGPNPAAVAVAVQYQLAASSGVRLTVHDALGRVVAVVALGARGAGAHEASVDASAWAPGVYVVRLDTPEAAVSRTLTVAR